MTKHALRACGRSPCAARRLPRAPQPAPPRLRHEGLAPAKPARSRLKKGRRRGRRRAWEAPSSAGGRAARAARFVHLTRRDCLSAATKERSEFPRRALAPSSTGELLTQEPDRRGRAPPPAPPALRCRLDDLDLPRAQASISPPPADARSRRTTRRSPAFAIAPRLNTCSAGAPSSSFLTGSSIFLPDSVRGIASTWKISFGTWRAESALRMSPLMRFVSASSSTSPGAQHDEQRHVALAAEVLEVDDEAIEHLGHRLDGAVQLGRAHADAVPVDRRVAAAVDDRAAARRDADPVAVAPDARVGVEVALAVAACRRRRPRSGAASTASASRRRARPPRRPAAGRALGVGLAPRLDRGAEAAALHLALDHRQRRQAGDEGAREIGAAATSA